MAGTRATFSLRFTNPELREAVRRLAEHEHVSQNEFIEHAIINDLTLRGALRAEHLRAAAGQLASLTAGSLEDLIDRSLDAFAEGEALPDPAQMRQQLNAPVSPSPASYIRSSEESPVLAAAATFRSHG